MKKTNILLTAALLLGLCASADAATVKKNVKKTPMKEWTMAVFLNADNNLDRFGVADQEEMSKIGSNENLNIVTLIDRECGPAQINYIENYKINKIKDMGELDMGDYKEFVKFVKFVKENYDYLSFDEVIEGIDEKGIDVKTGKVVVAVSEDFYRPTDVVNLWGDPSKAKKELGWNPQTTTFEQLVQIMVKHDMEKVAADHVASVMRTNLAEYLEKGVVK